MYNQKAHNNTNEYTRRSKLPKRKIKMKTKIIHLTTDEALEIIVNLNGANLSKNALKFILALIDFSFNKYNIKIIYKGS